MTPAGTANGNRPLDPLGGLRRLVRRKRSSLAGATIASPFGKTTGASNLKAKYLYSEASKRLDTFVLYRIIGNDLVPRHAKGQSRSNVRFILENEPVFPACEKRWILNRISDPDEEALIIELLDRHGQQYLRIPFDPAAYLRLTWDASGARFSDLPFSRNQEVGGDVHERFAAHLSRFKNIYAINNNGARNTALADGRLRAKWVLPFDGNCYFTAAAFEALRSAAISEPYYPYLIVPMARTLDNGLLLDPDYFPAADEEPQIAFRCDATQRFDERVPYGRRPKVELLWRLGVPGGWDRYKFDPWDFPRPAPGAERGAFRWAGWVARLESGRSDLESGRPGFINRGIARNRAVVARLDQLDAQAVAVAMNPATLAYYDEATIRGLCSSDPILAAALKQDADALSPQGPWSVMDKTTLPPSSERHDYWHPAPYWWPDARKAGGVPYVQRDGHRIPGTVLFGDGSQRYDRTSLQRMFDAATTLTIAWAALDEPAYASRAVQLIDAWFIDTATRMNPHLDYAQVRLGHNGSKNTGTGIIEFRDIIFLLDAVRLLSRGGHLAPGQLATLRQWLEAYARWLEGSDAGRNERRSDNNHGTFYDAQLVALGLFLGDARIVSEVRNRAALRLFAQLQADGRQPFELRRENPRHYCTFNLTGWSILAHILARTDYDLWRVRDGEGRSLPLAVEVLAEQEAAGWNRTEPFNPSRLDPLWQDYRRHCPDGVLATVAAVPAPCPRMHPDTALPPYWMLVR